MEIQFHYGIIRDFSNLKGKWEWKKILMEKSFPPSGDNEKKHKIFGCKCS